MSRRASAWAPAGLWAIVIFMMSTDSLSALHTRSLLEPLLRFLFPWLSPEQLAICHFVARKLAHVTEYLIFALLLDRGFRRDSPVSAARAPRAALVVAVLYALSDEGHQALVARRTPSLYDCGFDSFGAAIGSLIAAARAGAAKPNRPPR